MLILTIDYGIGSYFGVVRSMSNCSLSSSGYIYLRKSTLRATIPRGVRVMVLTETFRASDSFYKVRPLHFTFQAS
jgi:hypothetical protein